MEITLVSGGPVARDSVADASEAGESTAADDPTREYIAEAFVFSFSPLMEKGWVMPSPVLNVNRP